MLKLWEKVKKEKDVYLRLVMLDDIVQLRVVDEEGDEIDCGNLLYFEREDNKFVLVRNIGIDPDLGFKMDCGRVAIK